MAHTHQGWETGSRSGGLGSGVRHIVYGENELTLGGVSINVHLFSPSAFIGR